MRLHDCGLECSVCGGEIGGAAEDFDWIIVCYGGLLRFTGMSHRTDAGRGQNEALRTFQLARCRRGCGRMLLRPPKKRLSPSRPQQGVLARFADDTCARLRGRRDAFWTFSARTQCVDVEPDGGVIISRYRRGMATLPVLAQMGCCRLQTREPPG